MRERNRQQREKVREIEIKREKEILKIYQKNKEKYRKHDIDRMRDR